MLQLVICANVARVVHEADATSPKWERVAGWGRPGQQQEGERQGGTSGMAPGADG